MTLGEIIKQYREEQGMSQRKFATKAGMSNTYVSQLEAGIDQKTGRPFSPTMAIVKHVAAVIGVSVQDILTMMGDSPVDISGDADGIDSQIMALVRKLPDQQKQSLLDLLQWTVEGVAKK